MAATKPVEGILQRAAEASKWSKLKDETSKGIAEGYRKVVTSVVVAGSAAAFDGLQYLATHRSYISALLKWLIGAGA